MLRRLLEPANLLSLVRIPLAVIAIALRESTPALLVLAALAGLSDVLDGWVARRMHPERARLAADAEAEPIGAWLDPLCDKAFVLGWLLAIALRGAPPALLALVAVRDVGVAVLGTAQLAIPSLRARPRRYTARPSGKVTTVLQFAALVALVLEAPAPWPWALCWLAAAAGVVALTEYAARALRAETPRRGS